MKKLAEILTGPDTWTKGRFRFDGRICLVQALAQLHHVNPKAIGAHPEYERLERVIGLGTERGLPSPGISWWNDAPERTWDDVERAVEAYDRDRLLEDLAKATA